MAGIELRGVGKRYGEVTAVRQVDLSIRPAEFVTLLGPSGSGKTTTLRMIAGLERPSSGTVTIGGTIVSGDGVFVPVHRRRLGMVFQSYAVWPHMTVSENVAFPLRQQGVARDEERRRVESMLDRVGLAGLAGRYPSQLSGGQQQRVSLARALVAQPQVILFDEPLSNLDARLRDSMRDLIRDLHRQFGLTSVYVTHDQAEAMILSDRIFVMRDGEIVQSGSPEDLYERPADRFVAEFVGVANLLPVEAWDAQTRTVALPDGTRIACAAHTTAPASDRQPMLMVRPHLIRPASPDEHANVVSGRVETIAYLGDRLRVSVKITGGGSLMLDAVPGGFERPRVGETIRVLLPASACQLG